MATMQKITPFLWFDTQAEEAMNFYTSIFKNSAVHGVSRYGEGGPAHAGSVMVASFTLEGQQFTALNGGPHQIFNNGVSFVVHCASQEEVDYFWEKLGAGGQPLQCGWLKDRFGLPWQIVPTALSHLLGDPDPQKAQRAMMSIMQMQKLDLEKLHKAAMDTENTAVTIGATIAAPLDQVWQMWTQPEHVTQWNHASDDWHCPRAANDLRPGGAFSFTMAAKDGSFSFDFGGVYDRVVEHRYLDSTLGDGRKWSVIFYAVGDETQVIETFETESENSVELQRGGWQAILNNFKAYAER